MKQVHAQEHPGARAWCLFRFSEWPQGDQLLWKSLVHSTESVWQMCEESV